MVEGSTVFSACQLLEPLSNSFILLLVNVYWPVGIFISIIKMFASTNWGKYFDAETKYFRKQ